MNPGRDFVVMGTDGLFDNLFDEDIETCLKPSIEPVKGTTDKFKMLDPEATAKCIGDKAYKMSKDRRYNSPFAVGALKSGKRYIGGKEDDITVIVAQIVNEQ